MAIPEKITIPGTKIKSTHRRPATWPSVSVMWRSVASLGRIEIKVFVLGQPVDRIEEEVAVMLQAGPLIRGKIGIADDHNSRVLIPAFLVPSHAERKRPWPYLF